MLFLLRNRWKSLAYYTKLKNAILKKKDDINKIIKHTMQESLIIWNSVN